MEFSRLAHPLSSYYDVENKDDLSPEHDFNAHRNWDAENMTPSGITTQDYPK